MREGDDSACEHGGVWKASWPTPLSWTSDGGEVRLASGVTLSMAPGVQDPSNNGIVNVSVPSKRKYTIQIFWLHHAYFPEHGRGSVHQWLTCTIQTADRYSTGGRQDESCIARVFPALLLAPTSSADQT